MSTEITRRDFLRIAFTTVSAAVLSAPTLAQLLPAGAADLPVCPAYTIAIDPGGYLYDPTFDYVLPTYRDMLSGDLDLHGLSAAKQKRLFAKWLGIGPKKLDEYGLSLDDQVDPERCSPHWLAGNSEWSTGLDLYGQLDDQARGRLGLVLIDGEHPGSDFVAVRCDRPAALQEALLREGINIQG